MKQAPFFFWWNIIINEKSKASFTFNTFVLCFCLRQRFSEMKNERIKAKQALLWFFHSSFLRAKNLRGYLDNSNAFDQRKILFGRNRSKQFFWKRTLKFFPGSTDWQTAKDRGMFRAQCHGARITTEDVRCKADGRTGYFSCLEEGLYASGSPTWGFFGAAETT